MSKSFGPGANDRSNFTGIQVTSSSPKPSSSAMAQATAASKPRLFVGSPSSHGGVAVSPSAGGSKYGGNAGLSAPIVSVPAVFVSRLSFWHAADIVGATLTDAL